MILLLIDDIRRFRQFSVDYFCQMNLKLKRKFSYTLLLNKLFCECEYMLVHLINNMHLYMDDLYMVSPFISFIVEKLLQECKSLSKIVRDNYVT